MGGNNDQYSSNDELDTILAEMGASLGSSCHGNKDNNNNEAKNVTTAAADCPTVSNSSQQQKQQQQNIQSIDFQLQYHLTKNTEWMNWFQFKEHLFDSTICSGWKSDDDNDIDFEENATTTKTSTSTKNDVCIRCGCSRARHRLILCKKKNDFGNNNSKQILLLQQLFCYTRNIRCIASENIVMIISSSNNDITTDFNNTIADNMLSDDDNSNIMYTVTKQLLLQNMNNLKKVFDTNKQLLRPTDVTAIIKKVEKLNDQVVEVISTSRNFCSKENMIKTIACTDMLYYKIYYATLNTSSDISMKSSTNIIIIPDPSTYFTYPGLAWDCCYFPDDSAIMNKVKDFCNNQLQNQFIKLRAKL